MADKAPYESLVNLNHDPDLALALGNLIIVWSDVERSLVVVLHNVLGIHMDRCAEMFYSLPNFEARIRLISTLLSSWKPTNADRDEIGKKVEKLRGCAAARNGWVHGNWVITNDHKTTYVFNMREPNDSTKKRKPTHAADVRNHNSAVLKIVADLYKLLPIKPLPA